MLTAKVTCVARTVAASAGEAPMATGTSAKNITIDMAAAARRPRATTKDMAES